MTGILTNLKIDGGALGPLRWQINIHFNLTRRDFKKTLILAPALRE